MIQDDKAVDPFLIYGKSYVNVRDSLTTSREENAITPLQMAKVWIIFILFNYV